ncbi:MAG TPA: type II secretion system F family protein [Pseudonocardia sp.]|jgi:Flp pilus assembly protein TadB
MIALLVLAAALLVLPSRPTAAVRLLELRGRDDEPPGVAATSGTSWFAPVLLGLAVTALCAAAGGLAGLLLAAPVGVGSGFGCRWMLGRQPKPDSDPLRLAGGWDLLAACLRSGLPVPLAVRAVADHLPPAAAAELRTIADRLALGADPREAWTVPAASPIHQLARAALRSASSGAGLASVAADTAAEVRAAARDLAAARGQRASVLITGPLGLCFLPAFLALGVVPVVIGLAAGLAVHW